MNLDTEPSSYDFSGLEVFHPQPHPAVQQVIEYATTELETKFPQASFEFIPLGSGRGLSNRVKAIVGSSSNGQGWLGDLDLGIIIHSLPSKYVRGPFLYDATLACQDKAYEFGLPICNQFNLFNCHTYTSGKELRNKVFVVFSDIENFGIDKDADLPDFVFYQLFSLGLPFLSKDLHVRIKYIFELLEIFRDPMIAPYWTERVQKVWSKVFRKMILPPLKHFHDDPDLQREFIEQLGLGYL